MTRAKEIPENGRRIRRAALLRYLLDLTARRLAWKYALMSMFGVGQNRPRAAAVKR